ncbi:MAG: Holliday junction resolvase-like protein [Candidatus Anstonellales archaeon]
MEINEFYFFALSALLIIVGFFLGQLITERRLEKMVSEIREDAIKRSRSVLTGQFMEQIAPYLPNFKYSPTEVRFIGKPIDFIVFEGMDEKDIKRVIFVEVKTGKSTLSTQEKKLRDAVKKGKVDWEEYTLPTSLQDEPN